ncbi:MAG: hypothetical protein HY681_04570, partial [Chloroflexi bacterium]|nr:hypothetical protein [Chloroflexota bacterium]
MFTLTDVPKIADWGSARGPLFTAPASSGFTALNDIVTKALAKDRAARYAGGVELHAALVQFARGQARRG